MIGHESNNVPEAARVTFKHARGCSRAGERHSFRGRLLAAVLTGIGVGLLPCSSPGNEAATPEASPNAPAAETIESSGEILGVRIGMTMKEARAKLTPLRDPEAPRDEREKFGTRAYWKLLETEYDWMMAWANAAGKITRLRAVVRPEKLKPFSEIGDLTRAVTITPNTAAWNVVRDGIAFRITALGNDGHAVRISMLAFDPSLPQPPQDEEPQ